jgi:hypothetical protein
MVDPGSNAVIGIIRYAGKTQRRAGQADSQWLSPLMMVPMLFPGITGRVGDLRKILVKKSFLCSKSGHFAGWCRYRRFLNPKSCPQREKTDTDSGPDEKGVIGVN